MVEKYKEKVEYMIKRREMSSKYRGEYEADNNRCTDKSYCCYRNCSRW